MMIQEDRRGGRRSGRRGRLVLLAVLLALCAASSIQALAGGGYVDLMRPQLLQPGGISGAVLRLGG